MYNNNMEKLKWEGREEACHYEHGCIVLLEVHHGTTVIYDVCNHFMPDRLRHNKDYFCVKRFAVLVPEKERIL